MDTEQEVSAAGGLGSAIREAREAAGIGRERLGARIGVSGHTIARWEAEENVPAFDALARFAAETGADLSVLAAAAVGHTRRYHQAHGARPDTIEIPFDGVVHVEFPQHHEIDVRDPDPEPAGGHIDPALAFDLAA